MCARKPDVHCAAAHIFVWLFNSIVSLWICRIFNLFIPSSYEYVLCTKINGKNSVSTASIFGGFYRCTSHISITFELSDSHSFSCWCAYIGMCFSGSLSCSVALSPRFLHLSPFRVGCCSFSLLTNNFFGA